MPDVLLSFAVDAPPDRVFDVVAHPEELRAWWPMAASGRPALGESYTLDFGDGCVWTATVSECRPGQAFEWTMTCTDADWQGTRVGFTLAAEGRGTRVEFAHRGWPEPNRHFRVSAFCWAAYLRVLKRYIEQGDILPYHQRKHP